jgi:hypothetical protein
MRGQDTRYTDNMEPCTENHCILVTRCGHTELGPCETQAGDVLAVCTVTFFCTMLRLKSE